MGVKLCVKSGNRLLGKKRRVSGNRLRKCSKKYRKCIKKRSRKDDCSDYLSDTCSVIYSKPVICVKSPAKKKKKSKCKKLLKAIRSRSRICSPKKKKYYGSC